MGTEQETFFNRELSWLGFARRVLSLAEQGDLPLLERVRFAGIMGMLHDEFFMKRVSGLKRQMRHGSRKLSLGALTPEQEFAGCRDELMSQSGLLAQLMERKIRPQLRQAGIPLQDYEKLSEHIKPYLRQYFIDNVQPILTPLAVDAEHPFPFISNNTLNLAVLVPDPVHKKKRFLRIKVPDNRARWVPLPDGAGWVPLEQVIAANLDLLLSVQSDVEVYFFRVTRGAEGTSSMADDTSDIDETKEPGSIIRLVTNDLKARRFAGVVRLHVNDSMPEWLCNWLCKRLEIGDLDLYRTATLLCLNDLMKLSVPSRPELSSAPYEPVTHPRLRDLDDDPREIFSEIERGDILLHHPYDNFDTSVLRFLVSAAEDPAVLAIKVTIYRTNSDSPIVNALAEAARRGKQVAVLVEITARFDEAPNIAWGRYLENEGVHVAYGVERVKTHVKMALVVREVDNRIRRYAHIGTGNYHTSTARVYEDLGILTCNSKLCQEAAALFDELTGATTHGEYEKLIVAPRFMRRSFIDRIEREIGHAQAGRPSGIDAKMNQLQDRAVITALYRASRAGVPIRLNVRGLCCLRPGVPGQSDNIRVFSVVGRFLEHSRIYRFENGGSPEFFIGSADWMKRNLDNRIESVVPVLDASVQRGLQTILEVYYRDNATAWDCLADGTYVRRTPGEGVERLCAQEEFIRLTHAEESEKINSTGGEQA